MAPAFDDLRRADPSLRNELNMVTQELADLLYNHFHSFGQKEKNESAAKITDILKPGTHKVGDQEIVVDVPVQEKGWTRFNVWERPPK